MSLAQRDKPFALFHSFGASPAPQLRSATHMHQPGQWNLNWLQVYNTAAIPGQPQFIRTLEAIICLHPTATHRGVRCPHPLAALRLTMGPASRCHRRLCSSPFHAPGCGLASPLTTAHCERASYRRVSANNITRFKHVCRIEPPRYRTVKCGFQIKGFR